MGVATELSIDTRGGGHGEVVGHNRRCASKKGELALRHAQRAKWDKALHPGKLLGL
jgi:hypothetical protein